MDYNHNSECWYKDVCTLDSCVACSRFEEMKFLMDSSGIPKAYQVPITLIPDKIDYNKFVQLSNIKNNISQFVENGQNLFICSCNSGNGKTSWAMKLLLKYFDNIWSGNGFRVRGLFVHVPTLLIALKNFKHPLSEEYKQDLILADLVIFDDISTSDLTAYDYSNLLTLIDGRLVCKKSTIYTSNQTSKEALENTLGVRLASRIWQESTVIQFKGKDRRNGQFTNNF